MSITTPATFPRVLQQDLLTARLDSAPIDTILSRVNYAWQHHAPPLVNVAWLSAPALTRDQVYEFGIEPSVDGVAGLLYSFRHRWRTTTAGTMTITVEEWDGAAYNTIYGPTATATTATTWHLRTHTATVAANARRLRVTYAHGADSYWPAHLLAVPAPATTPAAKQPSGFVAFDNAQYTTPGAPIHAELLNRVKASIAAVVTDRKTMALSLVQDSVSPWVPAEVTTVGIMSGGPHMAVGRSVASLPGNAGKAVLSLHFKGYTSAAPITNYRCTVRQVGATHSGSAVSFDLDGAWQTGSLTVIGETPGIEVSVSNPDISGGETAVVQALTGFWTPGA